MSYGIGALGATRQIQRIPGNPLDRATVVSIYPREIREVKETIEPGRFIVPAGTIKRPGLLVVGSSSWWRDFDPEMPLIEIPVWATTVAESIVRDWANGLFMCDMGESMPGLFHLPGNVTHDELIVKYKNNLLNAELRQKNWYKNLVKAGDILWARSNGNPLSISDDMRLAAQELGLKDKGWMKDVATYELINCKFCGSLLKPGFPVCPNCHNVVDHSLMKMLKETNASSNPG